MFKNLANKISLRKSVIGGTVVATYLMYKHYFRNATTGNHSPNKDTTIDNQVESKTFKDSAIQEISSESQSNDSQAYFKEISSLWKKEYEKKGIPSSYRNEPSSVVNNFFYPYFLKHSPQNKGKNVVDMGCGLGRNSIFFAEKNFQVTAIDIVQENINHIQEYAKKHDLKITALCGNITEKIPAADNSIDIVIDIFCYKHQTDDMKREFYRKELYRILKDDGYYLLSLAGKNDGYYGSFLKEGSNKIIDPQIDVASVLFDPEDIRKEFSKYKIKEFQTIKKSGLMHGKEYERVTHAFIMKKDL